MNSPARLAFRKAIVLSTLVPKERLEQIISALRAPVADGPPVPLVEVDDDTLAAKMLELGILTTYQVEQLRLGRTKFDLGPYRITDFIAQGGMGQVFKGVHKLMGRECAVKVLPRHKATPEAIESFMREIRTQAQLDHPNLVRALDAGHDGDVHYLATEYVPGMDLRRLVRVHGRITPQQAASVITQACRALQYAHERGLVHRDVKPGNILVTPEGIAKVSDLGLAGVMQDPNSDPRKGRIVGTPDYLAPEVIRSHGGELTPVSDIYSLGATLYYCICGKVPFPGGTTRDKARRHLEDTPWHPKRFNEALDEEFIDLIADMMEKDPKARIQSAAEVATRLEMWAGDKVAAISQGSQHARWASPPPSIGDEVIELSQETEGGEPSAGNPEMLQGTNSSVGSQETYRSSLVRARALPGLPMTVAEGTPAATIVAMTLAIAVPISMFVGAVLASVLIHWLR